MRSNMNTVPALIAATQRPRELTRTELKGLASLLDAQNFSEASLRRAYGRARNADIAAHIIGFVRQAAIGDPLVPYEDGSNMAFSDSLPVVSGQRSRSSGSFALVAH